MVKFMKGGKKNMLKLEKVSKFYSGNGVVSTGFSKVDLNFKIGEFVAITGESGSGKSTLLNVISGLDSYEEGEMYVLGQPTSGFSKEDLEEYRKKYIGSIFQTFNLINSYSVYQNVELVLLLSGHEKKDVSEKVNEIIEKVGLSEYKNTKASKLSGGQKQRVAIARALARETPIIVADEPTGNLDSKSAAEIIELLNELSKDKLIIIVTHNYEQVENYITRKITMHDGRVVEDKRLKENLNVHEEKGIIKTAKADNQLFKNMVRLGVRNTFNIPAKFMLLLIVFIFLCGSVFSQYVSFMNISDITNYGYYDFFRDTGKERILVTKSDKSEFKDSDYEILENITNVERIVKNDMMLDLVASLMAENDSSPYYICGKVEDSSEFKGELAEGRMPEKEGEAVIYMPKDQYVDMVKEDVMSSDSVISDEYSGNRIYNGTIDVVGYGYLTDEQTEVLNSSTAYLECYICVNEDTLDQVRLNSLEKYCTQEIEFAGKILEGNSASYLYKIYPSDKVEEGKIMIPEDIAYLSSYASAGQELTLTNESLYFEDTFKFTVADKYTKDNINYYLGIEDFDSVSGALFISEEDYEKMFSKENFQSSVIVSDTKIVEATAAEIENAGFDTFIVNEGEVDYSGGLNVIENTLYTFMLCGILIVLFFITYFIVKLILKSRNIYFSTVRMLGAAKSNCSGMLKVELFTVFNIAYFMCAAVIGALKNNAVEISYISQLVKYIEVKDFVILYIVLCAMAILLASRYSRQLFKKSAMNAYKEEV